MILIIQSLWNEAITQKLVDGAIKVLKSAKIPHEVVQVPGALEMGLAIQYKSKKLKSNLKGAVACGAVIKGDTYHFELVANESARQLSDLSLKLQLPIGNAILTCFDVDQALERAGGKKGNKGEEGAHAVLQMIDLLKGRKS